MNMLFLTLTVRRRNLLQDSLTEVMEYFDWFLIIMNE